MFFANLNALDPLAVAASTVVINIVGWLWYSQPLFGRAFIQLSGIRPGDLRPEHIRRTAIIGFFTAIVYAALLGMIYEHGGHSRDTLVISIAFIWLFVMLGQLNGFLWRREPFALFLLQTFRSLAKMMAGGLVFTLFG